MIIWYIGVRRHIEEIFKIKLGQMVIGSERKGISIMGCRFFRQNN